MNVLISVEFTWRPLGNLSRETPPPTFTGPKRSNKKRPFLQSVGKHEFTVAMANSG